MTFRYNFPDDLVMILNSQSNIKKINILQATQNNFYPVGNINLGEIKYVNNLTISFYNCPKDYLYFPNIPANIKKN